MFKFLLKLFKKKPTDITVNTKIYQDKNSHNLIKGNYSIDRRKLSKSTLIENSSIDQSYTDNSRHYHDNRQSIVHPKSDIDYSIVTGAYNFLVQLACAIVITVVSVSSLLGLNFLAVTIASFFFLLYASRLFKFLEDEPFFYRIRWLILSVACVILLAYIQNPATETAISHLDSFTFNFNSMVRRLISINSDLYEISIFQPISHIIRSISLAILSTISFSRSRAMYIEIDIEQLEEKFWMASAILLTITFLSLHLHLAYPIFRWLSSLVKNFFLS